MHKWLLLLFCCLSVETIAQTTKSDELYQKHVEYKTLSLLQKKIFDEFIEEEIPKGTTFAITEKLG